MLFRSAQTAVPCPRQNKYYSDTFHLIDKGNQNEAQYDINFESHKHGWTPKLAMRLFNMNLNNAYKIYEWLVHKYTPDRRYYDMGEAITEAAHAFLQKGEPMRKQKPEHPLPTRNLAKMWNPGSGRKLRCDAKGEIAGSGRMRQGASILQHSLLTRRQQKDTWRLHQSVIVKKRGKCTYEGCPNLRNSTTKRKRGYDTFHKCEQCSAKKNKMFYLCNDIREGVEVHCHIKYHIAHHSKKAN